MGQRKVMQILVELRLTVELDEGANEEDISQRLEERCEDFEHDDSLAVDGGTLRAIMVHTHLGETTEVDEDASW